MDNCIGKLNKQSKYYSGQLWEYKTRIGDEDTRLLILKVDEFEIEKVIHVTIIGDDDFPLHMPFSECAIDKSVLNQCGEVSNFPNFQEGYSYWKDCYEKGKAGIYKISVAEALEL